ncbi:glycine--tRNA ligase subunit beta, partial [Candidatus Pelagibacter sp.]|nr:glycine--tRNA ligase subunit beta [Candidatus Pelagibacter sp.]
MSEFFLELFSEEIPSSLQKNFRNDLLDNFNKLFSEKFISFKKSFSYSTPNRVIIVFEGLQKKIVLKSEEIKGPNINAPEIALEGFMRSNNISKKDLFKKKIDKGEFYFFKTKSKKFNTNDLLEDLVPPMLQKIQWKKSMRWGEFDLHWGRPLKSILAIFDKKKLTFDFHHIASSNTTFVDKEFEEKKKIFYDFKTYEKFFQKEGIIVDQNKRKKIIEKEFEKILSKKNLTVKDNNKLIEEVVNLTDKPHIIECSFDKKFLLIPSEILILTMQSHQKYFPLFTKKDEITNEFLVVANNKDQKGLIKIGNERVVEARLNDAEFFWNKDKSQNLVKKVSELKSMNFFKGLGTYFDKVQRMRKLGALISDELLISKEKVELSASICKTDLISDSVGEFPELQGIMGSHLSQAQGFDKDVVDAIKEQYLPIGLDSAVPKKPYSITLSLTDRIDTLTGFFGINEKPSSSKDPYALRRVALGIIRIIAENKKDLKINDLISYSSNIYLDQGFIFSN